MLCRIAAWLASLLCLGTALAAESAPSLRRPVDAEWIVPDDSWSLPIPARDR